MDKCVIKPKMEIKTLGAGFFILIILSMISFVSAGTTEFGCWPNDWSMDVVDAFYDGSYNLEIEFNIKDEGCGCANEDVGQHLMEWWIDGDYIGKENCYECSSLAGGNCLGNSPGDSNPNVVMNSIHLRFESSIPSWCTAFGFDCTFGNYDTGHTSSCDTSMSRYNDYKSGVLRNMSYYQTFSFDSLDEYDLKARVMTGHPDCGKDGYGAWTKTFVVDTGDYFDECVDEDDDGYSVSGGECGVVDCDDDDASKTTDCSVPECASGQTRTCGSNVGACSYGTQTCTSGSWGSCVGAIGPTAEVCDGVDNDCDGSVDEGGVCPSPNCISGDTKTCGISNLGICSFGTQTCFLGAWGSCIGAINPTSEICDNGIDENCDGVDDSCSGDTTGPVVSLISPSEGDDFEVNDGEDYMVDFRFNVNDASGIANCFVALSGDFTGNFHNLVGVSKIITNSIGVLLGEGDYSYKVVCEDEFGNVGESGTRDFSVFVDNNNNNDDKDCNKKEEKKDDGGCNEEWCDVEPIVFASSGNVQNVTDLLILGDSLNTPTDSSSNWIWVLILIVAILLMAILIIWVLNR